MDAVSSTFKLALSRVKPLLESGPYISAMLEYTGLQIVEAFILFPLLYDSANTYGPTLALESRKLSDAAGCITRKLTSFAGDTSLASTETLCTCITTNGVCQSRTRISWYATHYMLWLKMWR
jgi:hypothetical protein